MDVMATYVEVYAFAADHTNLYHLPGAAPWRQDLPVMGDSNPGWELDLLLDLHGVPAEQIKFKDQASDRWGDPDRPGQVDTFAVVVAVDGFVLEQWPGALRIHVQKLIDRFGRPAPHPANELAREIRDLDVMFHALRHIAFQKLYSGPKFDAMPQRVRHHLHGVIPALAGLYQVPVDDAA
jgi:hypothetical protein